ncbi:nucleotidyltransferase family protein [Rhodococcus pyridinivorans]
MTSCPATEQRLLDIVPGNPVCRVVLDRAGELGIGGWYLTAGGVFQSVWNFLDGRDRQAGIRDYGSTLRTVSTTCSGWCSWADPV